MQNPKRFSDIVTPWRHGAWAHAGERSDLVKLQIDTSASKPKAAYPFSPTFLTRHDGRIIDPDLLLDISPTEELLTLIRATGSLKSPTSIQSGFWICEVLKTTTLPYYVDTETHTSLNTTDSVRVQLVFYNCEYQIGLFKAAEGSAAAYIKPELLMEEYELPHPGPAQNTRVGCVGYSKPLEGNQEREVTQAIYARSEKVFGRVEMDELPRDLEEFVKPGFRTFAPGTVNDAGRNAAGVARFVVTTTMWNGASGGPCVVLNGNETGRIVGFVHGPHDIANAYNIVHAFPPGFKDAVKRFSAEG